MIQWWSFFWKVLIGVIQSFAIYCQVPSWITCCQFFVIGQISGYEIQFLGINCKSSLDHKDENANEIRAVSKIKAGEEITLTYNWKQLAMKDWKTRQDNLWYNWGFRQAYSSFHNLLKAMINVKLRKVACLGQQHPFLIFSVHKGSKHPNKCQLISKQNCRDIISPKKRTQDF